MAILTKEQILGANDLETVEVEVPAWGGSVLVRALTARERGLYMSRIIEQRKGGNTVKYEDIQISLCAMSMVGEDGNRLFSNADVNKLGRKSSGALQVVFEKAQELSGLSDKEVEELAGNSVETPSDDSLSD